jgi:hypothetical protein
LAEGAVLTEVIHLAAGERPPAGEEAVIVSRPQRGRIDISGTTIRSEGVTTFSESSVGSGLDRALDRARELAASRGISRIYVFNPDVA